MERKIWTFNETNKNTSNTRKKEKYGYCRVSTEKQRLTRQIDDIKQVCPEAIILSETYTGTRSDRPEWQKLLRLCHLGFVSDIWFCDVSRMSRNKEEGYATWKELYDLGIDLHFIQTPQVDTTTYKDAINKTISVVPQFNDNATTMLVETIMDAINGYMISLAKKQIYIAFDEAEQEAKHLSQRTKEGMEIARMNGSPIGRKEGVTISTWKRRKAVAEIKKHYKEFGGTLNATECIRMCNIAKTTFYRYVKQIKKEMAGDKIKWTYHSKKSKKA